MLSLGFKGENFWLWPCSPRPSDRLTLYCELLPLPLLPLMLVNRHTFPELIHIIRENVWDRYNWFFTAGFSIEAREVGKNTHSTT